MYVCILWLSKRRGLRTSHGWPQPELRRPRHRCPHTGHRKYMVGSEAKLSMYRNIQRTLRKPPTYRSLCGVSITEKTPLETYWGTSPNFITSQMTYKRVNIYHSMHRSWSKTIDIKIWNTINYGKHSLRYQGPHIWSKLDIKLKGSSNIESFKKNITKKDLTSLSNNKNSCCNLCSS